MFTQKRSPDCDDNTFRWVELLILVTGYFSLLFATVVPDWFSNESIFVIALGYVVSVIIFIEKIDFVYYRIKKKWN